MLIAALPLLLTLGLGPSVALYFLSQDSLGLQPINKSELFCVYLALALSYPLHLDTS